jgi:hypothetical protein
MKETSNKSSVFPLYKVKSDVLIIKVLSHDVRQNSENEALIHHQPSFQMDSFTDRVFRDVGIDEPALEIS